MNPENEKVTFQLDSVVLDCPDAGRLADFYARMLGWKRLQTAEEWAAVTDPEGAIIIYFQTEPDYAPPVWPTVPGQQQMMAHLDFAVSDLEKAVAHAVACGAKLSEIQYSKSARVCFDPVGHPFCLVNHG